MTPAPPRAVTDTGSASDNDASGDSGARPGDTAISIALAISLIALVGIGLSVTLPLLSLEMERMGVSGTGIGINTAFAGLAAIAAVPFVPRAAAHFGLGRVLTGALLLCVGSMLLFWSFPDYHAWFLFRITFAVGLGTLFVLSEYWITTTAPADRRGIVMGIYATVLSLGFAAGPALLALVGTVGPAPYVAGAALFAIGAIPLWVARRRLPTLDHAPRHAFSRYLFAVPLASAAGFASGAVETGGIALLPVFGVLRGLAAEPAALLVSCVALGGVVSQIPLGLLSDRMSKAVLLAVIGAVGLAVTLLLPVAATFGALPLYGALFVWGGIAGGLYTVGLAHLAANYRGADLAGGNAAFVVMFNCGPLVGPPLVGAAMDVSRTWGFSLGMSVFFAVVLLAFVWPTARLAMRP